MFHPIAKIMFIADEGGLVEAPMGVPAVRTSPLHGLQVEQHKYAELSESITKGTSHSWSVALTAVHLLDFPSVSCPDYENTGVFGPLGPA